MAKRGQRVTQGMRAAEQFIEWKRQEGTMRVTRHRAWELTNGAHGTEGCYTMEVSLSTLASKFVK